MKATLAFFVLVEAAVLLVNAKPALLISEAARRVAIREDSSMQNTTEVTKGRDECPRAPEGATLIEVPIQFGIRVSLYPRNPCPTKIYHRSPSLFQLSGYWNPPASALCVDGWDDRDLQLAHYSTYSFAYGGGPWQCQAVRRPDYNLVMGFAFHSVETADSRFNIVVSGSIWRRRTDLTFTITRDGPLTVEGDNPVASA